MEQSCAVACILYKGKISVADATQVLGVEVLSGMLLVRCKAGVGSSIKGWWVDTTNSVYVSLLK